MDADEATAVLKILKDANSSDSTIEKFIHLLDSGIVRAEKYKGNFK